MDNNPILQEQSVDRGQNQIKDMSNHVTNHKKSKNMYVLNLDGSRIFWILSIILLLMTFVLLLGYWIGSDSQIANNAVHSTTITRTTPQAQTNNAANNTTNGQSTNNRRVTITEERVVRSTTPQGQNVIDVTNNSNRQTNSQANNTENNSSTGTSANTTTSSSNSNEASVFNRSSREPQVDRNEDTGIRRRITRSLNRRRLRTRRGVDTYGSDKYMTRRKPYSIQIATHFSLRTAMHVKRKLRNRRHSAYIFMHKSSSGKKFYKIRVGTFRSRSSAKRYLAKLKRSRYGRGSIIVHR